MYCSEGCREKDYHQTDCTVLEDGAHAYLTEKLVYEYAKILNFDPAAALNLMNGRERKTIFDFDLSDPEAEDYERTLFKIVNEMSKLPAETPTETPSMYPIENLHKHFWDIAGYNGVQFHEFSYGLFDKGLGRVILAFGSLLNHSCYPNIEHVMVDDKMVFIVTRPIKAGEQLFISYGPRFQVDFTALRKTYLQHYGFDCECVACTNNYPLGEGLLHKDPSFILPTIPTSIQDAVLQFKRNCDYINKNSTLPPSFEVDSLDFHNRIMVAFIASYALNNY